MKTTPANVIDDFRLIAQVRADIQRAHDRRQDFLNRNRNMGLGT